MPPVKDDMVAERVDVPTREHKTFSVEPFIPTEIVQPWGLLVELTPERLPYQAKLLHIVAGKSCELDNGQGLVTFVIDEGDAVLVWLNSNGVSVNTKLEPGMGYSLNRSQVTYIEAVKDSTVMELSTFEEENPKRELIEHKALDVTKPWGEERHFTPQGLHHMFKVLHLTDEEMISEQWHDVKEESWLLKEGGVLLQFEKETDGEMIDIPLSGRRVYTCMVQQRHRLVGTNGGGFVWEFSTAEEGSTYKTKDRYSRNPVETGEDRKKRDEEALNK